MAAGREKINDRLDRSPFKAAPNAADVWRRENLPDNLQSVFRLLDSINM